MSFAALFGHLGNIFTKVAHDKVEERYSARIPDNQIFRTNPNTGKLEPDSSGGVFTAYASYLQVLINHMYISDQRDLWVGREHLGVIWMRLRYNGEDQTVPFTLGREILVDKVKALPKMMTDVGRPLKRGLTPAGRRPELTHEDRPAAPSGLQGPGMSRSAAIGMGLAWQISGMTYGEGSAQPPGRARGFLCQCPWRTLAEGR